MTASRAPRRRSRSVAVTRVTHVARWVTRALSGFAAVPHDLETVWDISELTSQGVTATLADGDNRE